LTLKWPTAIVLVAHVPTTTPPERDLHAGKGTPRALTTGAPVMSAYERTYVRALTPLAGTRVADGPAGREASRHEVAGRVKQGARIFLQRVGEAAAGSRRWVEKVGCASHLLSRHIIIREIAKLPHRAMTEFQYTSSI
jgi:hypothetical protein